MDELAGPIQATWHARFTTLRDALDTFRAIARTVGTDEGIQGLIRRAQEALAALELEMDQAKRRKAA